MFRRRPELQRQIIAPCNLYRQTHQSQTRLSHDSTQRQQWRTVPILNALLPYRRQAFYQHLCQRPRSRRERRCIQISRPHRFQPRTNVPKIIRRQRRIMIPSSPPTYRHFQFFCTKLPCISLESQRTFRDLYCTHKSFLGPNPSTSSDAFLDLSFSFHLFSFFRRRIHIRKDRAISWEAKHFIIRDISIYITRRETQKWLALRSAFIGFITSHLVHKHIHSFKFSFVSSQFWESRRLCCFNSIQLPDVLLRSFFFLWEAGLVFT